MYFWVHMWKISENRKEDFFLTILIQPFQT